MKVSGKCPKCQSTNIIRIPAQPKRYMAGNNIYTTSITLLGKIPVIRYVCCNCGYVENWIDHQNELHKIKEHFG